MEKSEEGKEKKGKIKRQFSAGGVVYKLQLLKSKENTLWLLTKSNSSEEFSSAWRLPKGWIDDEEEGKNPGPVARGERKANEEELRNTAIKEVKEEGGVEAEILEKIGTERYFITLKNEKIMKFVTFYLMKWIKDLPEGFGFETEETKWFSYEDARKKLSYSGEKKILDKAKTLFEKEVVKI